MFSIMADIYTDAIYIHTYAIGFYQPCHSIDLALLPTLLQIPSVISCLFASLHDTCSLPILTSSPLTLFQYFPRHLSPQHFQNLSIVMVHLHPMSTTTDPRPQLNLVMTHEKPHYQHQGLFSTTYRSLTVLLYECCLLCFFSFQNPFHIVPTVHMV